MIFPFSLHCAVMLTEGTMLARRDFLRKDTVCSITLTQIRLRTWFPNPAGYQEISIFHYHPHQPYGHQYAYLRNLKILQICNPERHLHVLVKYKNFAIYHLHFKCIQYSLGIKIMVFTVLLFSLTPTRCIGGEGSQNTAMRWTVSKPMGHFLD